MVKFWVNRIKFGKATINDVPEKWREEVKAVLEKHTVGRCN